jgi:hypothetical protein
MSERRPPSRSSKAGRRGRHKTATSHETRVWNNQFLIPARPVWMDEATYRKLAALRRELEA